MEGWLWLSVGLFISLIFICLLYGDCIMRRVSPGQCGAKYGQFAVDVGVTGVVKQTCNGPCTFKVGSLSEAVRRCNIDKCQQFYYDTNVMSYLENSGRSAANGGIYTRLVSNING